MSLTYNQYVQALGSAAAIAPNDGAFVNYLPNIIDYAEQRIYREGQFLSTIVRDTGGSCTANNRNFTLPSTNGRFVVVEAINVVTPAGSTVNNGTRNPIQPTTLEVIDYLWPSNAASSATTIPSLFAMVTDQTVVFGSPPGADFQVEVIGTIRPTPLSSTNPTTYLSLYLPDLFLAASMIAVNAWQKNFGTMADDPKASQSWESQYQALFQSANMEEQRKKFTGMMR